MITVETKKMRREVVSSGKILLHLRRYKNTENENAIP
jgi:hypothetical protein